MKKFVHFAVVTILLCLWGLVVMQVECHAATVQNVVEIAEASEGK